MGYHYSLRHANLVAYLVGQRNELPRLHSDDLRDFLYALSDSRRLLSDIEHWRRDIGVIAQYSISALDKTMPDGGIVNSIQAAQILLPLRRVLSEFDTIALGVYYNTEANLEFVKYLETLAMRSRGCLFLIPENGINNIDLQVFDPSKEVMEIVERQNEWPGILAWFRQYSISSENMDTAHQNKYVFIPYRILRDMYNPRILRATPQPPPNFRDVSERIQPTVATSRQKNAILHISDLHFGTKQASLNVPYLLTEIARIKDRFARVIISGDLFDNPRQELAEHFRNFYEQLRILTGTKPIIIPGNHDQRWFGNFTRSLGQLSELRWENIVVDDGLQCVFFCFDSSKDANLARGKITKDQLMRVSTSYAAECVNRKYVADYLRVAVIHHHPYSFKLKSETFVQKMLKKFRMDEETFLRMDDADQFLGWCARRGVPLILHGHKHVQRHVLDSVIVDSDPSNRHCEITAIGCGTSLGVEDYPLSYNIIGWDPDKKLWMAEFLSDPGDGSGFQPQLITTYRPSAVDLGKLTGE